MHYSRWKTHGDPLTVLVSGRPFEKRKTNPIVCERVECGAFADIMGRCRKHYSQDYRKANRVRIDEYNKRYAIEHPEVRVGIDARQHQKNKPAENARARTRRLAHPEDTRTYWRTSQDKSLPTAARSGHVWTGWEIELLSDESRTAPELAVQLGRTMAAVVLMRHKIRYDPQTIQRAGLSESGNI